MKRFIPVVALASLVLAPVARMDGQQKLDPSINEKIRAEENQHSQIMRTLHFLTDVYGPRVTGTPSLKAAGDWIIKTAASWGFTNAHLEPWEFGHPGWTNDYLDVQMTSPVPGPLVAQALAWTAGTNGVVRAKAINLVLPEGPLMPPSENGRGTAGLQHFQSTKDQLTAYLNGVRSEVQGKVVFAGKAAFVPVSLAPPPGRRNDDDLKRQYDPNAPEGRGGFQFGGRGNHPTPPEGTLTARQVDEQLDAFLVASGAAVRVNDAARPHGQVIAYNNRTYDPRTAVPTLVMRNEDYGRIARILADGTTVVLEINFVNTFYPEGATAYNTVTEIAGSDKKDEVVMLGGHLDSWHSATGATDNAIGCATMLEAARILEAIGVRPRRTIRVALWSGEEEGLLGSLAYVKAHFGTAEEPKPEFAKLDAYLNIDSGTGRARGAGVFGPPSAAAVVRQALAPFADLGVVGASATRSRATGGTDSTSFNNAGLPGIGFSQDPIEYNTHTHHTNLDNYERVIESDAKASAMEIAATLYQLAMRDDMIPRFTKETMPPPVEAR